VTLTGTGERFRDLLAVAECPTVRLPWDVGPGDTDCDGYASITAYGFRAPESFIGTDPNDSCADTTTPNDERGLAFGEPLSPWPTDTNDNGRLTTIADLLAGGHSPQYHPTEPELQGALRLERQRVGDDRRPADGGTVLRLAVYAVR
jgi:hypothetical protein